MSQNKSKKGLFILVEFLVFISLTVIFYWHLYQSQLPSFIIWGALSLSFLVSLISGLTLHNPHNCVSINSLPLIEAWKLPPEQRIKKQQSLQILYFDLKTKNWAGFIQHSRDPHLVKAISDFAEVMAHPTKRYSRLVTDRFELRISGYEGKTAEILDKENRKTFSASSDNESDFQGEFDKVLQDLLEDLLNYYSYFMIDPLRNLDELTQLIKRHEYNEVFANLVKFAEIFDENHFDSHVKDNSWQVKSTTTDQSKFRLKRGKKAYSVSLDLFNPSERNQVKWKTNLRGEIIAFLINGKKKLEKESVDLNNSMKKWLDIWLEKCRIVLNQALPKRILKES